MARHWANTSTYTIYQEHHLVIFFALSVPCQRCKVTTRLKDTSFAVSTSALTILQSPKTTLRIFPTSSPRCRLSSRPTPPSTFLKRGKYRSEVETLLKCQGGSCPGNPPLATHCFVSSAPPPTASSCSRSCQLTCTISWRASPPSRRTSAGFSTLSTLSAVSTALASCTATSGSPTCSGPRTVAA